MSLIYGVGKLKTAWFGLKLVVQLLKNAGIL